ncbi:MAG: amidase family protein [Paracoccaceae bacterium]|nr:amidase family protein [Paracoccaceae bacterium]
MDNWLTAPAAELGRGIEAGKIDPRDLTERYLTAIAEHPFASRIYARLTEARARAEADAAADRAKKGLRRSPLDGVPISWKDLYDIAGVATESGTALLAGRVPDRDARVLTNATQAGLVCLGKTHQTELAFSGLGLNPVTASPPCVNDHDAVSGGSSSGAGTSVAFGLAAAGIGSDTGGSVRIPCVWNDLVGLKTRHGRLSLEGVVPLCARFDTVGPLCRNVEDAALLLAAMENGKAADLTGASLKGVRLGALQTQAFNGIEGAAREAFQDAIERLQAAGATTQPIEIPAVAEAAALAPTVFPAEAFATWQERIDAEGDKMYGPVRTRFLQGQTISAVAFIQAWRELDCLRLVYAEATAEFDAVVLPSCPILPPKAEALLADEDLFTSKNLLALQNTRIGNLMGLAAITLPTGTPSTGLMLQGPNEERLLRLAVAAEEALR